jgi:hypothetical protein
MTSLPSFETYCDNTTAVNALLFDLGCGLLVWFSYRTPVAFALHGEKVVRRNEWGPTTGKHLNAIEPDKRRRVSSEAFEAALTEALEGGQ